MVLHAMGAGLTALVVLSVGLTRRPGASITSGEALQVLAHVEEYKKFLYSSTWAPLLRVQNEPHLFPASFSQLSEGSQHGW